MCTIFHSSPLNYDLRFMTRWLWKAIQFLIWRQLFTIKPMGYVHLKMFCLAGCIHFCYGSYIICLKNIYLLQILEIKPLMHGDKQ